MASHRDLADLDALRGYLVGLRRKNPILTKRVMQALIRQTLKGAAMSYGKKSKGKGKKGGKK